MLNFRECYTNANCTKIVSPLNNIDVEISDDNMEHQKAQWCFGDGEDVAHVALSADLGQIDGLIVTVNSATLNAGARAEKLCFHVFVLGIELAFVADALQCAFGNNLTELMRRDDHLRPTAFIVHGRARVVLHDLDADEVWRAVGLPSRANLSVVQEGDAFRSDTGNLFVPHNFVRFVLHELLPDLQRVVYLDVDVVVRGDLTALYQTSLLTGKDDGSTLAAVQRTNQPLRLYVDVLQPSLPNWLPSEAASFNAGVMVIDLVRWRQRNAVRLVAQWLSLNTQRRLWSHGSQPPLLLLFYDEVAPLHWSWNIDGLGHRLNYPKDILREANLLHWTGPLKPWRHHGVNRKLWEPYTLEYCPEFSFREHTTTCRPDSWHC